MRTLKQWFCKHEFESGGLYDYITGYTGDFYECTKCGFYKEKTLSSTEMEELLSEYPEE